MNDTKNLELLQNSVEYFLKGYDTVWSEDGMDYLVRTLRCALDESRDTQAANKRIENSEKPVWARKQ